VESSPCGKDQVQRCHYVVDVATLLCCQQFQLPAYLGRKVHRYRLWQLVWMAERSWRVPEHWGGFDRLRGETETENRTESASLRG
jgi:hypothetical protein